MGLSQKTVWLIIALMVVSLTGLVGLQASLLRSSLESKEDSFRRSVLAAMGAVVADLETMETTYTTIHVVGDAAELIVSAQTNGDPACLPDIFGSPLDTLSEQRRELDVRLRSMVDVEKYHYTSEADRDSSPLQCDTAVVIPRRPIEGLDTAMIMIQLDADSGGMTIRESIRSGADGEWREVFDSSRVGLISRVMDRLVERQQVPIEDRLDSTQLDSSINRALAEYGIDLEPVYGVIPAVDTGLLLASEPGYGEQLVASEFKTTLFPGDILAAPNRLTLFFPDRGWYLFKQIGPLLALTVMFMVVVVGGFTYTVRTIIAQRRTSRQLVEFVNNMTHEFKTPISTVALAAEAILRRDVISDTDKVARFSRMIQDENRRMRHQAEKILQMAALEEKQGKLKLTSVDVHEVIGAAADSLTLQVEKRGGRITRALHARNHVLAADRVHLTGIIHNLLDNANKYSPDAPDITIATADENRGIRVMVEDRGVGLEPEDARRIFDQYFRVSHGNIHDVKGFGLGLSYVNLMVRAHGGKVTVQSKPGEGTRLIVWLPLRAAAAADDSEVTGS